MLTGPDIRVIYDQIDELGEAGVSGTALLEAAGIDPEAIPDIVAMLSEEAAFAGMPSGPVLTAFLAGAIVRGWIPEDPTPACNGRTHGQSRKRSPCR